MIASVGLAPHWPDIAWMMAMAGLVGTTLFAVWGVGGLWMADAGRGGRLFGQCATCHTVRMGAGDRNGPSLYDVVGKPVASNSRRFGYTRALGSMGGVWTPERLDAWLASPAKFALGTSMSFRGVPDPLDRADIVVYLQTQSVDGGGAEALPSRP
jgi:cytochrome c